MQNACILYLSQVEAEYDRTSQHRKAETQHGSEKTALPIETGGN